MNGNYYKATLKNNMRSSLFSIQAITTFIFYSFIAATLLAPIASNLYAPSNTMLFNNIALIYYAKMALTEGHYFIQDVIINNNGLHYPFYQFYSPTTYELTGFIYRWITPSNPFIAYKIILWLSLVLGGIYMQRLSFWFLRSIPAAALTSLLYLTSPYYIVSITHSFDLSQSIALGIMPIFIYYIFYCYCYSAPIKNILLASILGYFLITIHLMTFFYTSFTLFAVLLLVTVKNTRYWKKLILVVFCFSLASSLSTWYLAPVLLLKYNAHNYSFFSNASFSGQIFTSILSLVISGANYIKDINILTPDKTILAVGLPILFSIFICCYILLKKVFNGNKRINYWFPYLFTLFLMIFVLSLFPFNFGVNFQKLFISQTSWIGALLAGYAICWLFKNNLNSIHFFIGTFLILSVAITWLPPSIKLFKSVEDFVNQPKILLDESLYPLIKMKGILKPDKNKSIDFLEAQKNCIPKNKSTVCKIPVSTNINLIELPFAYFPSLWDIKLNGKDISYINVNRLNEAIVGIRLEPGVTNTIKIKFAGLKWANNLSAASWFLCLLITLYSFGISFIQNKKIL